MNSPFSRTPTTSDFLVVEYEGRRALISRNPNYQETISAIKRTFGRLRTAAASRRRDILISALLEEIGDWVRITPGLWSTILPGLTTVKVHIDTSPWAVIFIKTLTGKTLTLGVDLDADGIHDVKDAIFFQEGIPPDQQRIVWTVDAKPDGTLLDHASGREVAYLFWEAYTNPKAPISPPTSRPSTPIEAPTLGFDPAYPVLTPSQSVLLPFDKVTAYIDDVLIALGLHTEARTSFITYWLPNLSKHAYIALRFLPQDEYEKAAPLNITPAPEVMTRVFMLFMGIEENEVGLWEDALAMAREDVVMWRDIVGVDFAKVHDKSLFRVLEWGGMEVE
ncbi:hypothetical protein OPQ81_001152 [Rhizoctonia solani]|nr:hypothetical protein OPQ81_001152 [Rhizoctonia solani]